MTKCTLLEHLITMMIERYPDCTDLHGELTGVHRVAKVTLCVCVCVYVYICLCVFLC